MRRTLIRLAVQSGQPFSELLTWEPRDIATLSDDLDESRRAQERGR